MKKNEAMKKQEGFTLVELIIVIAIIALLIAMIAPNLTSFLKTANDTTFDANAKTAYTSANAWLTEMKVQKVKIANGNIEIQGAATPTVTYPTGSDSVDATSSIVNMFNASELKSGIEVTIKVKDGFAESVEWTDGTYTGKYPKD